PIQSEKSPILNIPFENDQFFNLIYSEFECPICYDFCELKLQLAQCGHGCCVECWKNHVISKFFSFDIKCCFNDCSQKLSLSLLKYVLPEQKFEKYQIGLKEELLRQNFIKCPNCHANYISLNNDVKKCPKCNSFMEKNGGCDHMRCICALNFNWSSVKSFSLVYNHKELNKFRRFFLVELTPKIKIKDNFLKNIVKDFRSLPDSGNDLCSNNH
ncbi:E3 ubiquitin- ligase ARIH2, partial [Brachionus plicatilis]